MKVKEITKNDVADYLKIELSEYEDADRKKVENFLDEILITAKKTICDYNGLTKEEVDESENLNIPIYILCAEMYDRRSLIVEKSNSNKVLDIIMGLNDKNFL